MQQLRGMLKLFWKEPLWFRLLILSALLASIVFSSSVFTLGGYAESISKFSAAIFFIAFGVKMRRNTKVFTVFLGLAVLCLFLAWNHLGGVA